MPTLTAGNSATVTLTATQKIALNNGPTDYAVIEAVSGVIGASGAQKIVPRHAGFRVYGPFGAGDVKVSAITGSLEYQVGTDLVSVDAEAAVTAELDNTGAPTGSIRANGQAIALAGAGDMLAANNLSDVADAATARDNLGLAIGTDVDAFAATASQAEAEAGLVTSVRNWTPQRIAQAIAALANGGPGSVDWGGIGGTLSDQTDLNTALAGKAASSHSHAEGDVTGLTAALAAKQPLDTDLTAIAALTSAANKMPYATGAGTWALADLTAAGRAILDDANAAAQLTTLGVSSFIQTLLDDADQATALATLGASSALASVSVAGATNLVRGTHANRPILFGTAATHTVEDDTTGSYQDGDSLYGWNVSGGNVVLQGDGTATVTAAHRHTLTIPSGAWFTLSRTAANTWRGGALDLGTAAALTAAQAQAEVICIPIGDETTAITTGTAKVTFRMPFAMTVTAVRASLATVSSSGTPTFDINEGGTSILGTKLSIDANEKTSTTAASAATITDSSLADDAEITIDVDTAGTGAAGAKIYIIGNRT